MFINKNKNEFINLFYIYKIKKKNGKYLILKHI